MILNKECCFVTSLSLIQYTFESMPWQVIDEHNLISSLYSLSIILNIFRNNYFQLILPTNHLSTSS